MISHARIRPVMLPLLIVENDLRGSFVDLKLGAHFLDLCIVLFQTCCDSFHLLSIG
jgi:hypothetical protein